MAKKSNKLNLNIKKRIMVWQRAQVKFNKYKYIVQLNNSFIRPYLLIVLKSGITQFVLILNLLIKISKKSIRLLTIRNI